jgi:hypothetical protein
MKPIFETIDQRKNRDSIAMNRDRRLPVTDCNYHSIALGGFNSARSAKISFRSISANYFEKEARHDFAAEASFFVAIILTAAIPLVYGVAALAHFVSAIG